MSKVRLELKADFGPKRGHTFSGIVVEPDYDEIMRVVCNKLKLKKGSEYLLVLRDKFRGAQVLSKDSDLKTILRDGATVVITMERPQIRLPKPPRWPWPSAMGKVVDTDEEVSNGDGLPRFQWDVSDIGDGVSHDEPPDIAAPLPASISFAPPTCAKVSEELGPWHGPWPVFQGNVLPLLRKAIEKEKSFLEKNMGEYIAFDYHASNATELPAMFPDPQNLPRKSDARLIAAVRRECRGLLVCAVTGHIIARRLPKFFNINELEETGKDRLPDGGIATEKLDGSLVSPVLLGGKVRWAGKSARVDAVEEYAARHKDIETVADLVRQGVTPIFEWCQAGPPVAVIAHAESRLVLIAVRDMITGEFWADDRLRALPCDVVKRIPFEHVENLVDTTRQALGMEGVVIAWPELGCMVKLKTSWWITMAASQSKGGGQPALALKSALQQLPLSSIPQTSVWQAVLTADDDQIALVYSELTTPAQASLRAFVVAVQLGLSKLDEELREWAECVRGASESELAAVAGGWPASILGAYERRAPLAEQGLRKFLMKLALAGDLLAVEAIVGTTWDGSRQTVEFCGHLGEFDKAPDTLVSHVISQYLPRKIQEYMGHAISDEACVRVDPMYEPSEGKIKGMWELFEDTGVIDLRVDLQPRAKTFNFHNGDRDFAHWQVQFGPNDKCPRSTKQREGARKGCFAGVLLRTGVDVSFGQLRDAMRLSFSSQKVVKLDPSPSRISQIYMDLDGVLVDFEAGFLEEFGCIPEPKARWQYIERTAGFFEALPWMDSARRLWEHMRQTGLPITILTGIPEGTLGQRSAVEKRAWVARELGEGVEVITCLTREKPMHSGPGRLLIDDRPQKDWEMAGGRQVLHRELPETMLAAVDMGLGRPFSALRENIHLIDTLSEDLRVACDKAEALALDAEWPPDRAGSPPNQATLLQLAFRPNPLGIVYIIDMLAWDVELQAYIRDLLVSDLPKLTFGPSDVERLGMRMSAVTDVQEESLSLVLQARRSGLVLNKSKQLQAADWSARPLRDEQLTYAATDALVLFELEHTSTRSAQLARKTERSHKGGRNATIEYTGIFLTAESRRKLLRILPPQFASVAADHMTLTWRPDSVKGLAIGSSIKVKVTGFGFNDSVQAVSVVTQELDARSGHITISHGQDAAAVEANDLEYASRESFTLDGNLGVCVILSAVNQNTLPESMVARVYNLLEGQPGQSERFEHLTKSQRYALHVLSDELGLEHRSEGKKETDQRKIILTRPRRLPKLSPQASKDAEKLIVKDPRKFAALFGDVPGLFLHGRITRTGITWEAGTKVPPTLQDPLAGQCLVIMRGFPGCGKSSLATLLQKKLHASIISADNFWKGSEHLHEAHEKCRQEFLDMLGKQQSVILDNTNVRMSDYAFYRSNAEIVGYSVVVLEVVCESTAELERFRKRSLHDVPGGAVGGMWARWEQDPVALRLAAYVPQELMPWLTQLGMIGHPPFTHLMMPKGPFLSIPPHYRSEFFERFAAEWGQHYISEQARPEAFKLFFDIDKLPLEKLIPTLQVLRELTGVPLMVTGTTELPPGHHVFAPGKVVDVTTALDLRRQWLEKVPWLEHHVDKQIYNGGKQSFLDGGRGPALRLVGSRKISKEGVDTSRVHSVVGRFDLVWEENPPWEWSDVSILE